MTTTRQSGTIRVDAALTNVAIDYANKKYPLAMGEAFPILPVSKDSGKYYKFDKNHFIKAKTVWRPGSTPNIINPYNASTATYSCIKHKSGAMITDDELQNADDVIQPRVRKTKKTMDNLMLELEREIATALQDSSTTYSSYTSAVSNAWSTDSSTPLADVNDAKNSIRKNAAVDPMDLTLILGYDKMMDLQNNAEVRDQFKYTSSESITPDMLARFFGVKKVIVSAGVYNDIDEGQDDSMSDIWTPSVATLLYAPDSPALDEPSAGYIAEETLYGTGRPRVRRYRAAEGKEADIVETTLSWDIIESANEAVYVLTSV